MMRRWLQQHLTDLGLWNDDGISRKARIRHHHCGSRIVIGLDAERAALPAVADLAEVGPVGEALALLDGRATFALQGRMRLELDRRDRFAIAGSPAGSGSLVLPEHRCGSPPAGAEPIEVSKTTTVFGDEPPY